MSNTSITNISLIDPFLHELSLIELAFWTAMYSVIALAAVGGNLLVIYVTVNRSLMQSVTSLFIVNLAISDLITGMFWYNINR
jgi:hypothetical protein